jgi:hypothetical protein
MREILPSLLSTRQRQNDMNGRNDVRENIHDCRDCTSFQRGSGNIAASHV